MAEDIRALNPAFHRVIGKEGTDFYGFVVIDEFISGRGTGGIRFTDDVSLDEIARLAREMTLKFAFLKMPSGGAKSGMVVPAGISAEERTSLSVRFGEAIGDLIREGKYVAGLDMGTDLADMASIMAGAGIKDGTGTDDTGINSNYYTAVTVLATADGLLEARGRELQGTTVLLEGLGKVGSNLARLLDEAGARLVGISTLSGALFDSDGIDVQQLLRLKESHGDDCVLHYPGLEAFAPSELFLKEADVLVPGGGPDSINADNVDRIAARFIVPIANIAATMDIEAQLHERGIAYIPGFVANSGGVFCWRLAQLGPEARDDMIRVGLKRKISRLVIEADSKGEPIALAARGVAEKNLRALKAAEQGGVFTRFRSLLEKLSPRRVLYILGATVLNTEWSRRSNPVTRAYFDARYYD